MADRQTDGLTLTGLVMRKVFISWAAKAGGRQKERFNQRTNQPVDLLF